MSSYHSLKTAAELLKTPNFKIIDVDNLGRPTTISQLPPQLRRRLATDISPKPTPPSPTKKGIKVVRKVYQLDKNNLQASIDAMSSLERRQVYGSNPARLIRKG